MFNNDRLNKIESNFDLLLLRLEIHEQGENHFTNSDKASVCVLEHSVRDFGFMVSELRKEFSDLKERFFSENLCSKCKKGIKK